MPINPDALFKTMAEPTSDVLPWLNHAESLTDKLKKMTGDARLQVLSQRLKNTSWWDRQVLSIDDDMVVHREICMQSLDNLCWYARTIIPQQTFNANEVFFKRLENEPLTKLIFKNPTVVRDTLILYPILPLTNEYHWLSTEMHDGAELLWARLASFNVGDDMPFYLFEAFLPGLVRCMPCN